MMKLGKNNKVAMLIGGDLVESVNGKWLGSVNPATEEVIGYVPDGGAEDVHRAVLAANEAYPAWAALGVEKRGQILRKLGAAVLERADELLHIEVQDTGNTITPMRKDVRAGVDSLEYYAGLGWEIKGETIPATPENLHMTIREPYGVVARIVPFNHPIMFAVARTAAALMAGNAVIIKPPETSPLSAGIFAEICREHLPPGVMNVVTGLGATCGDAISRHPDIRRIAFIGSPNTGMAIQRSAAEVCVKNVSLELGGKNPMIVFPDADMDAACDAALRGMNFAWQGQSCGSTSRLMLHDSIYDEFLERVVARAKAIKPGDPMSDKAQMGPINSFGQYKKVMEYIDIAKADGARLMAGGKRPEGKEFDRGYWVEPTVFADVTADMRIAQEEVFGPILSVMRWREPEEAIQIANSTEYGLTASIWSSNINKALLMARAVRSGYIWVNGVGTHFKATPFGGMKNSGLGREESIEEILSYTEVKTLNVMLPEGF
jgi:acyl-CoA reductase-like NAD-dependent aldehyde dehydrogenase